MKPLSEETVRSAIAAFRFDGTVRQIVPYGNGHINDTLRVTVKKADGAEEDILFQRLNTEIFRNPAGVMENISQVTAWLKKKIALHGGDPARETLTLYETAEGKPFLADADGNCFRAFRFIGDALSLDLPRNTADFSEAGAAFGRFQMYLADFPADRLKTTIPDFHNTGLRLKTFEDTVKKDPVNRAKAVQKEIDFVLSHAYVASLYETKADGEEIPLRVTHNDTKLNNVMLDAVTGKGLCVADLDTVMPGYVMNDFGDAIRSGASTAAEDETDLSGVTCDMRMAEAFAQGFLGACGTHLTKTERRLMPYGAIVMTYETGMRFLTDYLEGDTYYHIRYPSHNLDRARNQLHLVADMESRERELKEAIDVIGDGSF